MSLLMQAMFFEKYGPRLTVDQLSEVLHVKKTTLYNQISAGTCAVPTYVDSGKRFADVRDVAQHFDSLRQQAA